MMKVIQGALVRRPPSTLGPVPVRTRATTSARSGRRSGFALAVWGVVVGPALLHAAGVDAPPPITRSPPGLDEPVLRPGGEPRLAVRPRKPDLPPPSALGVPPVRARDTGAGPGTRIERITGHWIEGPGFDVTYGADADGCAARCLARDRCVMIEYYRPERKCNLYDTLRPRKAGGSSIVGIRR